MTAKLLMFQKGTIIRLEIVHLSTIHGRGQKCRGYKTTQSFKERRSTLLVIVINKD